MFYINLNPDSILLIFLKAAALRNQGKAINTDFILLTVHWKQKILLLFLKRLNLLQLESRLLTYQSKTY